MPLTLKTALALGRVSNLPTVWMNLIAGAALSCAAIGIDFPFTTIAILLLALSCFYAGGMCLNDYCDRHWDSERQPFRPIPAGKVSAQAVLALTLLLFSSGLTLITLTPYTSALWTSISLLLLITAYDIFHKRHWLTVILMASTRTSIYVIAALATTDSIHATVLVLGLIQGAYTLLVTIVARWENTRAHGFNVPVIPWMLAAMALLDGLALAILLSPYWLILGLAMTVLTRWAQRHIRGD